MSLLSGPRDLQPASRLFGPTTRWLLLLGAWTLPPFLIVALSLTRGDAVPSWLDLAPQLVYWLSWAVVTPLVVALGRRFSPAIAGVPLFALVHIAASAVLGLLLGVFLIEMQTFALAGRLSAPAQLWEMLQASAGVQILFSSLVYWLVLLVARGLDGYRRLRWREALLVEARLAALKAQVQPHFLFNALNAVSSLIDEDPEAAQVMIARLAELLRASLHKGEEGWEVTLGEEVELLRLYLAIEEVRFEGRLAVTLDVAEDLVDALVPQLLLQPLAENAVHHGISRDSEAGRLEVHAVARGTTLELRVEDDGPGPSDAPEDGIGLGTVRARLRELYGHAGRFELRRREPRGTVAVVELPLRRAGKGGRR
jgi:two-component system LytT family sensor kinase